MKTYAGPILLLFAAGALILLLGPRFVYEPWVAECAEWGWLAERLEPGEAQALAGGDRGAGEEKLLCDLALANGVAAESLPPLGPWAQLFDADNDGDLDLFALAAGREGEAGGGGGAAAESRFVLHLNDGGGRFREVGELLGPAFTTPRRARAAACADLDGDCQMDLAVALADRSYLVLWNRLEGRAHVGFSLRPRAAGPARIEIAAAGRKQVRWASGKAHFGLGSASRVDTVDIQWSSGAVTVLEGLERNSVHEVSEQPSENGEEHHEP